MSVNVLGVIYAKIIIIGIKIKNSLRFFSLKALITFTKKVSCQHGEGMYSDSVSPIAIVDEMKQSYLDYKMSVIVSRALPDVRDGLKPVHRHHVRYASALQ